MMEHHFMPEVAAEIGTNGAVIFQHLLFWITKNQSDGKHFYDGKFWTYSSVRAMADLFPYMTKRTIRYELEKLGASGFVQTGNYNKLPFDNTTWYAIGEKGNRFLNGKSPVCQNCQTDVTKLATLNCQNCQTNTIYKKDISNTPMIPTWKSVQKESCFSFSDFWEAYGKKTGRKKAEQKYTKVKEADRALIRERLPGYIATTPNVQYRKNPLTWLNGECWNDELPTQESKANPNRPAMLSIEDLRNREGNLL